MQVGAGAIPDDMPEPLPGLGEVTPGLRAFAEFIGLGPALFEAAAGYRRRGDASGLRTAREIRDGETWVIEEAKAAEARRKAAVKREVEERARAAQLRRIELVEGREETAWREAEAQIGLRLPKAYVRAAELLGDLLALAARDAREASARKRIAAICAKHLRKRQFIQLCVTAGLYDLAI